jgi:short-subunit dehydrogenase
MPADSVQRFRERYGPWALVTGASSGIGAQFARQLAARGLNLVLVARRLDRLQELAAAITRDHGCEVRPVRCDLSTANVIETLEPHVQGLGIGLLVNNAGVANTGAVVDNDLERELQLLYVNCRASLMLARHLGRPMSERGRGGIVFLSSTSAFGPAAGWANYSASKAYALALGQAMSLEMRPRGVDVLAVCPGPSPTGLYEAADQDLSRTPWHLRFLIVEPASVAATALEALGRKPVVVVGWGNRLVAQLWKVLPRGLASQNVSSFVAAVRLERPRAPRASS